MQVGTLQKQLEQSLKRPISENQIQLLLAHLRYVLAQNRKLNLTSIREEDLGITLHIEDSLTALPECEAIPDGPFVDLGSGAGFPGIPLAIVTGRNATLVEATQKKARVLQSFVHDNGLGSHITVEALRIEEFTRKQQEGGQAQFVLATARALSSLPSLMELAAPLLQHKGILLAYKGGLMNNELEQAAALEEELGMTIRSTRSLTLSDGQTERIIIQIQKTGHPKRPLPRRNGQAQRHPFKKPGSHRVTRSQADDALSVTSNMPL
jgi:16S rRNA (guanine527-N7)-methyltransferase